MESTGSQKKTELRWERKKRWCKKGEDFPASDPRKYMLSGKRGRGLNRGRGIRESLDQYRSQGLLCTSAKSQGHATGVNLEPSNLNLGGREEGEKRRPRWRHEGWLVPI